MRRLVILTLGAVSAACGGGGGGGGSQPAPSSNPPPPPPDPRVVLTAENTTTFSELTRELIYAGTAQIDLTLFNLGNPDFPEFSLPDGELTNPCAESGNSTVTVSGGGADATIAYDDCSEVAGDSIDGSFGWLFTNVDSVDGSFDFTLTYNNLRFASDAEEALFDGEVFVHTEADAGTHIHEFEIELAVTGGPLGRTFAEALTVTIRHNSFSLDALELTAIAGSIGADDLGSVDLQYVVSSDEVRMLGSQSTEAFFFLRGAVYGARFVESSGSEREIRMQTYRLTELETADGVNTAPIVYPPGVTYVTQGAAETIDLQFFVLDRDFEFLDFTLEVVDAPEGATLEITQTRDGVFEIIGNDSGIFTLRLGATDRAGASGTGEFPLEVLADTDGDGLTDNVDTDDDNDGVPDTSDALPLDPTESVDSDGDGIGDNADPDDDNDGVDDVSDAFPHDPACSNASDGEGDTCYLSSIQQFDRLVTDANGVVYFTKFADKLVYRWDSLSRAFLSKWTLGSILPSDSMPTAVAYVPNHGRVYFGYSNGAITYFDTLAGIEQNFATLPSRVGGLGDAGNFLLAQDDSGAWNTHYIYGADGSLKASEEWNYYSRVYAYSPVDERVYFFRDQTSPNDLHYEQIDQTTGAIVADGETPYHGNYLMVPPIVIAPAGDRILIGSGNLFSTADLTWAGSVTSGITDAEWDAIDGLIAVYSNGDETRLERRNAALDAVVERLPYPGQPVALVVGAGAYFVITRTGASLAIYEYTPSDDSDGDGVLNEADDFPLDPAASVDTDSDGYPDAWNPGYSEADSTTGLVIDAYPMESACYLPEHGDGTNCDFSATLPDYLPDAVAIDTSGIVYLLSTENQRVYRYSAVAQQYLSPIVVGTDAPAIAPAPHIMEYAPEHDRLYLGYTSGSITAVDLGGAALEEQFFANLPLSVDGLGAAGEFILAQDESGAWNTHYYFDQSGTLADSAEWNHYSRDYEWNDTLRRIYFFRDDQSPNDILYEEISATGEILSSVDSPYHGSYSIQPPILIAPDDTRVLLGSGDIYLASDLTWSSSLLNSFVAGVWDANGNVTTARDLGGTTRIDRYDASQAWVSEEDHVGQPLALLEYAAGYMLVSYDGAAPVFTAISR